LVLLACLFLGNSALDLLGLEQESISIAGGIVLFLIALRMIFPGEAGSGSEALEGEPFLVPLAVPLLAGPSALATLLLFQRSAPGQTGPLLLALTIAWALSGVILLSSTFFYRLLRQRGLIAMERLMGMLLVMIAVQMFMNGIKAFLAR
ncbi:MAG: MarC family protein, partial [Burkholderiales bacterium]